MNTQKKNVAVLAACQALLFVNNSTLIALNGLAGYALARDKSLATLPVTGWVIGAALSTYAASLLMQRVGRRAGFTMGAFIGILGAAICCAAIYLGNFWLLCAGTVVFGVHNAFGQYYRFAAADAATSDFKSTAISLVLAGGLLGGIIGPQTSRWTVDLLATRYLGSYLTLIGVLVLASLTVQLLNIPAPTAAENKAPQRPLMKIMAQPTFIVAVMSAAIGYGVMNLLMTATPLAMGICGHPYNAAALVISSHMVAMFGPSFFTGSLIKRFGVPNVMFAGVFLLAGAAGIAISGISVPHFWLALVLLGVGWNFLYISGTTLLTECYRPSERAKAQGANDFLIFLSMAASSFSSGMLLEKNGWETLNYISLPFIALGGAGVVWLIMRRPAPAAA
jgi:MFS family permease